MKKLYKFNELNKDIQAEIIYGKILDTVKACLLGDLCKAIANGEDPIKTQCDNELYDINGNYIKEV